MLLSDNEAEAVSVSVQIDAGYFPNVFRRCSVERRLYAGDRQMGGNDVSNGHIPHIVGPAVFHGDSIIDGTASVARNNARILGRPGFRIGLLMKGKDDGVQDPGSIGRDPVMILRVRFALRRLVFKQPCSGNRPVDRLARNIFIRRGHQHIGNESLFTAEYKVAAVACFAAVDRDSGDGPLVLRHERRPD